MVRLLFVTMRVNVSAYIRGAIHTFTFLAPSCSSQARSEASLVGCARTLQCLRHVAIVHTTSLAVTRPRWTSARARKGAASRLVSSATTRARGGSAPTPAPRTTPAFLMRSGTASLSPDRARTSAAGDARPVQPLARARVGPPAGATRACCAALRAGRSPAWRAGGVDARVVAAYGLPRSFARRDGCSSYRMQRL